MLPSNSPPGQCNTGQCTRIASSADEIRNALRLVHDAYHRSGLMHANRFKMRVTPYHLLQTTEVLVACQNEEVRSTLTVVRDGELGLPMEAIYGRDIALRRKRELSCAEITCLAERYPNTKLSQGLLIKLMSFALQFSIKRSIDELLFVVHPRHASFYQSFWGASLISSRPCKYAAVRDRPAVALSINVPRLKWEHPRVCRRAFNYHFPQQSFLASPMSAAFQSELSRCIEVESMAQKFSQAPNYQASGDLSKSRSVA